MAELLYQGHASFRVTCRDGFVLYVDPYAGTGYDVPADLILVTHEHPDHSAVQLVRRKDTCEIIRSQDMLVGGTYKTVSVGESVTVQSVPAYNAHHNRNECVGYVITVDRIVIYASGDTSYTDYMEENLSKRHIDYAFLPVDGIFNMDVKEAVRCADLIGAVHAVPIHMKPGALFDQSVADLFTAKKRLIIKPGEKIILKQSDC